MLQIIVVHAIAALIAPLLIRFLRGKAYLLLALVPAAGAVWVATQTGRVLAGDYPTQGFSWVPTLGLDITFRLDTLSWLMGLIVGGIGALILVYCSGYFARDAQAMGRFAGVFVAFAGAMFGLVTTDNTLTMYLFWELTTVFSYLLIGHYHERQASRLAATQSITVTTAGGLAMLAGLIMLGVAEGGSFNISELVAAAADGTLVANNGVAFCSAAVLCVLFGALTKSAQIPFHFWLPAAMAAPTPVSAYLHSSAMVKAGVYLIARIAPGFADLTVWRWSILVAGLGTMLLGGYRAMRQFDLKLLLAFGTVSQLGFIILLVGFGDSAVALAGVTMLLSHALFKSTLFMVVGTIDHEIGTRDLRKLSGLAKIMPGLMIIAVLAAASMAGLPPTLGYLGKESALAALFEAGTIGQATFIGVVIGSVLTMGYSLRFLWGAFVDTPGIPPQKPRTISWLLISPMVLVAAGCIALGFFAHPIEQLLSGHADLYRGNAGHLALWAGVGPALGGTVVVIGMGIWLFVAYGRVLYAEAQTPILRRSEDLYRDLIRRLNVFSADVTARVQRGSLPSYLSTMLNVMVGGVVLVLLLTSPTLPTRFRLWDSPIQGIVCALACIAAIFVVSARHRMKAVLIMAFVGYAIALIFVFQGAPDLALTQVVVESVSLVVFVLVMRRLPLYFSDRPWTASRISRVLLGTMVGVTTALLGWFAATARIHEPVTVDYPAEVYEFGYGLNIVNVTLVDTRAWDTVGEISVLLAATAGVISLIYLRQRPRQDLRSTLAKAARKKTIWGTGQHIGEEILAKPRRQPSKRRGRVWLAGSLTLAKVRRSLIFEIGARLIFFPLMMFSLYLLMAGHNAPGGGFAGGMVAGIALVIRYLAGGRYELRLASKGRRSGIFLGGGMAIATVAALAPVAFGGTVLQTTVFDIALPLWGNAHITTALFFDIGVYLIVVGMVSGVLASLGGEIDRQAEAQGLAPKEISFDNPTRLDSETIDLVDLRESAEEKGAAK